MVYLADANLLIASALTNHNHHQIARTWFEAGPQFATTPITELALIRVAMHQRYGLTFSDSMNALKAIQELPNRVFWPADEQLKPTLFAGPIASGLTTDAYLLALSKKHGGKLATFDQGIKTIAKGLEQYLEVLKV